jgi:benzodiazapine receptor
MSSLDQVLPSTEIPSRWRRRIGDIVVVATPLVVGGLSGAATAPEIRGWYRTLRRPMWNPPDAVFGPVWTTLYLAMGVALRDVVRADGRARARALAVGVFGLQLALNAGWSWLFFVKHDLALAAIEVACLWLAIVATIVTFGLVRRRAAALLIPYLAWVSFASALTVAIWQLNR